MTHQPGQRREAAAGGKQRRQDAGARRSPGAQAPRGPGRNYAQGQARPRHPRRHFLYHGLRREELYQLKVKDIHRAPRRHPPPHPRQRRQDPLRAPSTRAPLDLDSTEYLDAPGHAGRFSKALPCSGRCATIRHRRNSTAVAHATPSTRSSAHYMRRRSASTVEAMCAHALRATAGNQCSRSQRRHRQSAGVVRPRQHRHDSDFTTAGKLAARRTARPSE